MSNSNNILYLLSFMLLMLTGCEADSSFAPLQQEEELVEVRFNAAIIVGANATVTRANYTEKSTFADNDKIGIWNTIYENISLTYNSTTTPNLSTTDNCKIYYPYGTDEMTVYAYAPYHDTAFDTDNRTVKVKSEWATDDGLDSYIKDPLWAKYTVTKTNPLADFDFKHQMARLKIYLVHDDTKTYTSHILTFTFDRQQYGEMSLVNGGIIATEQDTHYTENAATMELAAYDEETSTPVYDHTIIPGSTLKNIAISFTDGTTSYSNNYTINKTFDEPGKAYHLIINFKKIVNDPNTDATP